MLEHQETLDTGTASHGGQGYAYDYEAVPPLAMQRGLPLGELPSVAWIRKSLSVALTVVHNQRRAKLDDAELSALAAQLAHPTPKGFIDLVTSLWHHLGEAAPSGRPRSLADYNDQFRTIPLPPLANVLHDDDAFAWMRVAGPNPTAIQRATRPAQVAELTNDGVRSVAEFANDSLETLISSGRLIVADYRQVLAGLEYSEYPDGPKFAYKPAAWFGVPRGSRRLVPIAILPDTRGAPQYAPAAGNVSWSWNAAKTVVASADNNHHEIISHLARTHLFVEPFIVATHLALPEQHPVSLLLRPHFEGTIFINWSAIHFLISKGGTVDRLQAGTIASSLKVAADSLTRMTFDEAIVPRSLAARGFGGPVAFDYPYHDDALALWGAIHDWIASYLAIFYPDDRAVQSDRALQLWSRTVRAKDGGRVTIFPELQSLEALADALSAIVFAASAQHAAGNFPQKAVTAYSPLSPCAAYAPVEKAIATTSEAQWLDLLPPLDMASLQLRLTYTLGSVHHTQIGRYDLPWFLPTDRNVEVQERLSSFHHSLGTIEAAINARNARLPLAFQYPYLLPSQIPQSINI
jgi:arachidonate 15-lipoxygenase